MQKLGFRYTGDTFYAPTGLNHSSYLLTRSDYESHRQSQALACTALA
jgi:hypothetical protein